METFTQLDVWHVGMKLVKEVYVLTKKFSPDERFGLTSQLRRASTIILANYAEGYGRKTYPDKAHKYTIARGECSETHALLLVSVEIGEISREEADNAILLSIQTGKMLTGLIRAQKSINPNPNPNPNPVR